MGERYSLKLWKQRNTPKELHSQVKRPRQDGPLERPLSAPKGQGLKWANLSGKRTEWVAKRKCNMHFVILGLLQRSCSVRT